MSLFSRRHLPWLFTMAPCSCSCLNGHASHPPSPVPELFYDANRQLVLPDAAHFVWGLPHQLNDGNMTQVQPAGGLLQRRGCDGENVLMGGKEGGVACWLTCSMEICIL